MLRREITLRSWAAAAAFLATACAAPRPGPPADHHATYSASEPAGRGTGPGCLSMMDSFCDFLDEQGSPDSLIVSATRAPVEIQVRARTDDLPLPYFEYAQALLRNRAELPGDLREALDRRGYFGQLETFVALGEPREASSGDKLRSAVSQVELESEWDSALFETEGRRMQAKFRGRYDPRLEARSREEREEGDSPVPIELELERTRIYNGLVSEISKAVWSGHPHWSQTERNFGAVRDHLIAVIRKLELPAETREDWIHRLASVRLALPGSLEDPTSPDFTDEECMKTESDAYYSQYFNSLTVCAGEFNGEDGPETIAHELGHALDIDSSRYAFQKSSRLGKRLAELKTKACGKHGFSCRDWSEFKRDYPDLLFSLRRFRPDLPAFQSCLQRRQPTRRLEDGDLDRLAEQESSEKFSDAAKQGIFLRLTMPEVLLPDGTEMPNPGHLEPCFYSLWREGSAPVDDRLTSLVFFDAEYRCGTGSDEVRFERALGTAKAMDVALMREVLRTEGRFSPREELETEGFASSPSERFADVLGSYALADALRELPTVRDRRNSFLATSSWQCAKSATERQAPAKDLALERYIFDPHTSGTDRMKEVLTQPLREVLGCRQDFSFKECSLEMFEDKSGAKPFAGR